MASLDSDTIDWIAIESIDKWLDNHCSKDYINQPLAQDWARAAKVIEELGEAIEKLILFTGQNPRKKRYPEARQEFLNEMADVVFTAILCMQHFSNNTTVVKSILKKKLAAIAERAIEDGANTGMRA